MVTVASGSRYQCAGDSASLQCRAKIIPRPSESSVEVLVPKSRRGKQAVEGRSPEWKAARPATVHAAVGPERGNVGVWPSRELCSPKQPGKVAFQRGDILSAEGIWYAESDSLF